MQYTTLGHSDIKISKLCLGGMSFGEASPDFHQWTIGPDGTRAVIKGRPGEKALAGTTKVKTTR